MKKHEQRHILASESNQNRLQVVGSAAGACTAAILCLLLSLDMANAPGIRNMSLGTSEFFAGVAVPITFSIAVAFAALTFLRMDRSLLRQAWVTVKHVRLR